MSASKEAYAYSPSEDVSIQPSQLDPRFAANESMQFTQGGKARAFGFSYVDGTSGRQVTEWVFAASYVPPPHQKATAEAPTDPSHSFQSLDEWKTALSETGPGAIWQKGSTFARSWVATFSGVPSGSPEFYAPFEHWPTVSVAPPIGDLREPQQVDPGSANAPAGPVEKAGSVDAKAALRVVTAADAGHPERGDTTAYTVEFWAMFSSYLQPTVAELPIVPGAPAGVPSDQTLKQFLTFWNSSTAPEAAESLAVVTCSRSRVNPYQA